MPLPRKLRAALKVGLPIALALAAAWAFLLVPRGDVSVADAHRLVQSGARLVDVRSPAEFAAGHLPGAINIPVGDLSSRMGELEPKDRPVVLYCRSGHRSSHAARALKGAGYSAVYNLGAMKRW